MNTKLRNGDGDLTSGIARVGLKVRCVKKPDMSAWSDKVAFQYLQLPSVGGIYYIRANILVPIIGIGGVLLKEIKNPEVRSVSSFLSGEPFFQHCSFNVVY